MVFDRDRRTPSAEEGQEALAALRRRAWEQDYKQVRREITDAEKAGDRALVMQLLGKRMELERKINQENAS